MERISSGGSEAARTYLNQLKKEGFLIEEDSNRGLRIRKRPDRLFPPWIKSGLDTRTFGRVLFYTHTVDSTQKEAKERVRQGAPEGATVLCEYQRKGRGRRGRSWESSPCANILMSVVARMPADDRGPYVWTQIGSLAVSEIAEKVSRERVWIKWPNDLYLRGRKLCGILAEREELNDGQAFVVMGIGLNVKAVPKGDSRAICLKEVNPQLPRRADLVQAILQGIESWRDALRSHGSQVIRQAWIRRSCILGRRVTLEEEGEIIRGEAKAFLPDGRLVLVDDNHRERVFAAGDVSILPPISDPEVQA